MIPTLKEIYKYFLREIHLFKYVDIMTQKNKEKVEKDG